MNLGALISEVPSKRCQSRACIGKCFFWCVSSTWQFLLFKNHSIFLAIITLLSQIQHTTQIDTCQAASLTHHITSPNVVSMASSRRGENSYALGGDGAVGVSTVDRFTAAVTNFASRAVVKPPGGVGGSGSANSAASASSSSLSRTITDTGGRMEPLKRSGTNDRRGTVDEPCLSDLFASLRPQQLFSHPVLGRHNFSRSLDRVPVADFFTARHSPPVIPVTAAPLTLLPGEIPSGVTLEASTEGSVSERAQASEYSALLLLLLESHASPDPPAGAVVASRPRYPLLGGLGVAKESENVFSGSILASSIEASNISFIVFVFLVSAACASSILFINI
jgi:hypothetical protein